MDNRPGAGGNIGGTDVARSAPDGHTLLRTTSGIQAINPALYAKMPFDPNKDLTPVAALVSLANVLVVHPSLKDNTAQELIALAKALPGALHCASSGSGTSIHLSLEMFKQLTKTDITHVPYKGSAPALTDLLGGQVQMMFDNIPSRLPHIRAGKLRARATTGARRDPALPELPTTGARRDPALPELPTTAEAGVAGYEAGVWFGLAAPTGTPRDAIQKIADESTKGTKAPEFIKRMTDLGDMIMGNGPDPMAEMLRAEVARWARW